MSPFFLGESTPYFFNQRRERPYQQRRLRKTPEERRDGLWGDGESVVSTLRPKCSVRRGSASSSRRISLSGKAAALPPVDRDGPRLVSGEPVSGEAKPNTLASLQEEEEEEEEEKKDRSGRAKDRENYKFNELKFGSTSILSNLAKCLDSISLREEELGQVSDGLDPELVRRFLLDHRSLTSDIVVQKREWQTDCYLDLLSSSKNRHPFLTAPPGEEEEEGNLVRSNEDRRQSEVATLASISQRYTNRINPKPVSFEEVKRERVTAKQHSSKRVTLNQEVMSKPQSPRRPQTAHSVLSNISFHSDYSRPSSADVESKFDHYDVLPAELRPPSIMLYKRESLAPQLKVRGPRTRLEKYRDQSSGERRKTTRIKIKSVKQDKESQETTDTKPAPAMRRPSTAIGGHSPAPGLSRRLSMPAHVAPVTINFSLTDSDTLDKGWVVHAEETQDPEMATLRIWDRKSKERLRKREEEKMIARQKNADGPLVVKFYSDPQMRSLRSKHQRSATFPLPAVLNKLPPSVASFTAPGVGSGDVMMIGEGPELAVLVMPDSSGHAYYHTRHGRRQAVCQSRADQDSRGLYTVAYDDTDTNSVLGCFTPQGKGWCYFPGPASRLHMYYDTTELRMYNEDGHVMRRSLWASDKTSVSIQLGPCLSFHCTSQSNMVLRFSCRGQTYKFNVSPPAPLEGHQSPEKQTEVGDTMLQSGLEFISDTARAHTRTVISPSPPTKPSLKTNKKTQNLKSEGVGRGRSVSLVVGEEGEEEEMAARETGITNLDRTLAHYRERIRSTVDEWMTHYREVIGISVPAHLRAALSRSPPPSPSGPLPSPLRLRSSRSFVGEIVHSRPVSHTARYHTHPLPSRAASPFVGQRSPLRESPEGDDNMSESVPPLATPIPATPTPLLPFNCSGPAVDDERVRAPRLGGRKARSRSSSVPGKCRGCPVALHNLLLKGLASVSPCRCDKRRPPFICDLEYDTFLTSHIPSSQVIVICILASIVERSCPCEPMLDALHYSMNRRRFSPCTESMGDQFRILKYDLSHSLLGTDRAMPLLVERHRVWPGMFLMYVGGRLVHADSVFNGYGTTKRDFLKQVERCVQESSRGHYIPTDYQFNSCSGGKTPASVSWAWPLGGVLGSLVPYSPSLSASHCSSTGHNGDNRETPFNVSRQSGALQSELDLSQSGTLYQFS